MAKNKEINVFSVSFLDLLSGALAAVIILFIVIPKATPEDREALETLQQMEVSVTDIQELLEQARNSVPRELMEQIQQQINRLNELIATLRQQVEDLQRQLAACQQEQERLRQEHQQIQQQLQQQIENLQQQLAQANQTIAELQQQIPQNSGISNIFFGVNAKLGIVCTWEEDLDVDVWLRNNATGDWCYYEIRNTPFATLTEDLTSRVRQEDFYELIYQRDLIPGDYDIYIHLYNDNGSAVVSGYVALFPGQRNEKKITYGPYRLTNTGSNAPSPKNGGGVKVGTLVVTSNDIQLRR